MLVSEKHICTPEKSRVLLSVEANHERAAVAANLREFAKMFNELAGEVDLGTKNVCCGALHVIKADGIVFDGGIHFVSDVPGG